MRKVRVAAVFVLFTPLLFAAAAVDGVPWRRFWRRHYWPTVRYLWEEE